MLSTSAWKECLKNNTNTNKLQQANARYKYALRHIKINENTIKANLLARKLLDNNYGDFWKAIKMMNNNKISPPYDIEGICGSDNIATLWREHYNKLFNSVKSNTGHMDKVEWDANITVRPGEVLDAIKMLDNNKACGTDGIAAEHLKYASYRLSPMLAMCFSSLMVHGVLPDSILSVLLVPVLKEKTGRLNSMDNYRPIAIASILSKVLERIILYRMEKYLLTTDNQFGFKSKHSTDLCIYVLKEAITKYQGHNSSVFLCFIDASKAFDRINHRKLFDKLLERDVPKYIIRVLMCWYAQQTFQVKWDNSISAPFNVGNGVRQGGILSPLLFNIYMDELSKELNKCKTGCIVGNQIINHLMYADDLVVFCPSTAGLQQMLNICTQYGRKFDIHYNSKKSKVMVIRSKEDKASIFPTFHLSSGSLDTAKELQYLGHVFSDDLRDDGDVRRQYSKIYAQANTLLRKFSMCPANVKCALFRAYITPLYTSHLWSSYTVKSMQKLRVAYNDAMRLLLQVPRWHSASQLFVDSNIPTCQAVLRKLMFKFMHQLDVSQNSLIMALVNPVTGYRFASRLRKHWHDSLYMF